MSIRALQKEQMMRQYDIASLEANDFLLQQVWQFLFTKNVKGFAINLAACDILV